MKQLPLPLPPSLERWPELASLAILDAALSTSESALIAVCPELHCGAIGRASRGSTVARASAVILQARRLAAALVAYRNAVDRDARRADRELARRSF
jgi:hypothetical protein